MPNESTQQSKARTEEEQQNYENEAVRDLIQSFQRTIPKNRTQPCCLIKKCGKKPVEEKMVEEDIYEFYRKRLLSLTKRDLEAEKNCGKCIEDEPYTTCVVTKRTTEELKKHSIARENYLRTKWALSHLDHDQKPKIKPPREVIELEQPQADDKVPLTLASPSCSRETFYKPTRRLIELKRPKSGIFLNPKAVKAKGEQLPFQGYDPRTIQTDLDTGGHCGLYNLEKDNEGNLFWVKDVRRPNPEPHFKGGPCAKECLHHKPQYFILPDDLDRSFPQSSQIIQGTRAIEAGESAQDYRRPKEIACLYFAFSRLFASSSPWDSGLIDNILDQGEELHQQSVAIDYKNGSGDFDIIPEIADTASAVGLYMHYSGPIQGNPNLFNVFSLFFDRYNAAIFSCEDMYLLIWKQGKETFNIFDPNGREEHGCSCGSGKATLITTSPIEHLVYLIQVMSSIPLMSNFVLYEIKLTSFGYIPTPLDTSKPQNEKPKKLYQVVNKYFALIPALTGILNPMSSDETNSSLMIAYITIAYIELDPPIFWTVNIIDNLIKYGSLRYRDFMFEKQIGKCTIHHLPKDLVFGSYTASISINPFAYMGSIENMSSSLDVFFKENSAGILEIDASAFAIWRDSNFYYVLDPFRRGYIGKASSDPDSGGVGYLQMHINLHSLCRVMGKNAEAFKIDGNYFIHGVKIDNITGFNANKQLLLGTNFQAMNIVYPFPCPFPPPKYQNCDVPRSKESLPQLDCLSILSESPCERVCSESDFLALEKIAKRNQQKIESLVKSQSIESVPEGTEGAEYFDNSDVVESLLALIIEDVMGEMAELDKNRKPKRERKRRSSTKDRAVDGEERSTEKSGQEKPRSSHRKSGGYKKPEERSPERRKETGQERPRQSHRRSGSYKKPEERSPEGERSERDIPDKPLAERILLRTDEGYLEDLQHKYKRGQLTDDVCKGLQTYFHKDKPLTLEDELKLPSNFVPLPDGSWIILSSMEFEVRDENYTTGILSAVVAVALSSIFKISTWGSNTLDYIYSSADVLSEEFDPQKYIVSILLQRPLPNLKLGEHQYNIEITKKADGDIAKFQGALNYELQVTDKVVVIFNRFACAIVRRYNFYYLFVGFPSDLVGFRTPLPTGYLCLTRYTDFYTMMKRIDFGRMNAGDADAFVLCHIHTADVNADIISPYVERSPSNEDIAIQLELENQEEYRKLREEKLRLITNEIRREKRRIEGFKQDKERIEREREERANRKDERRRLREERARKREERLREKEERRRYNKLHRDSIEQAAKDQRRMDNQRKAEEIERRRKEQSQRSAEEPAPAQEPKENTPREDKPQEDKSPEDKSPEDKPLEDKSPEDKPPEERPEDDDRQEGGADSDEEAKRKGLKRIKTLRKKGGQDIIKYQKYSKKHKTFRGKGGQDPEGAEEGESEIQEVSEEKIAEQEKGLEVEEDVRLGDEEEEGEQEEEEQVVEPKHIPGRHLSTEDLPELHIQPTVFGYRLTEPECLFKIQGSIALEDRSEAHSHKIKNCHFANVLAILYAILKPLRSWDSSRIDHCVEKARIMGKRIKNKTIVKDRIIRNMVVDDFTFSVIVSIPDILSRKTPNAVRYIKRLSGQRKYFILQVSNTSFAIYKDEFYHLFDPYKTLDTGKSQDEEEGDRVEEEGCDPKLPFHKYPDQNTASWILFAEIRDLVKYVNKRAANEQWMERFKLYVVNILKYSKANKDIQRAHALDRKYVEKEEPVVYEDILCLKAEVTDWLIIYPKQISWSRLVEINSAGVPRSAAMDKEFDIEIPGRLWSLWGNIHPTNVMFGESKGKQFLAINVMAICMINCYRFSEWNKQILDNIVFHGDRYFKESITDIRRKDYELTLEDLGVSYNMNYIHFQIHIESVAYGRLYYRKKRELNLAASLGYFFSNFKHGVIQINARSLAFGKTRIGYYMFDCQAFGLPLFPHGQGKTYILRSTTLQQLLECIVITFNLPYYNMDFVIHKVEVAVRRVEEEPELMGEEEEWEGGAEE